MAAFTPSQTIGPFFHTALGAPGAELVPSADPRALRVEGRVLDGAGAPVDDALLEIWQADAEGRYAHPEDPQHGTCDPSFSGFGRVATRPDGSFAFVTLKPGRVASPTGGMQAPHLVVSVFARGLLRGLTTRMYFPDEAAANAADPALASVDPARRGTLVARADGARLVFDIRLRGAQETVFFDV